jgi:hypothetical protein
MALLICEGPCNPDIGAIDEAVILARGDNADLVHGPSYRATDLLTTLYRRAKYTPHQIWSMSIAQCTVCGHHRRYGAV